MPMTHGSAARLRWVGELLSEAVRRGGRRRRAQRPRRRGLPRPAGLSVLVLERLDHVGGAAVSAQAFAGHAARLSRYSYLVSLMPEQLIADLDLDISLASRTTASYTPTLRDGKPGGLLVERPEGPATAASFEALTGGDRGVRRVAGVLRRRRRPRPGRGAHPALAPPHRAPGPRAGRRPGVATTWSRTRSARRSSSGSPTTRSAAWSATDALIGTFASLHDPSLIQNRCFLYHLIGNGTGEWRVPVGGMGAVTDAPRRGGAAARAPRSSPRPGVSRDQRPATTAPRSPGTTATSTHTVSARFVLANVAPWVLRILMGEPEDPDDQAAGRPAQDQLPARPAAPAQVRRRPGGRLRRHPPPRRGLHPARGGVRRRRGRPGARR